MTRLIEGKEYLSGNDFRPHIGKPAVNRSEHLTKGQMADIEQRTAVLRIQMGLPQKPAFEV